MTKAREIRKPVDDFVDESPGVSGAVRGTFGRRPAIFANMTIPGNERTRLYNQNSTGGCEGTRGRWRRGREGNNEDDGAERWFRRRRTDPAPNAGGCGSFFPDLTAWLSRFMMAQ